MKTKSKEAKYQPIAIVGAPNNGPSPTSMNSYQNPAGEGYAITDKEKKYVTYCVIDGRLLDPPPSDSVSIDKAS